MATDSFDSWFSHSVCSDTSSHSVWTGDPGLLGFNWLSVIGFYMLVLAMSKWISLVPWCFHSPFGRSQDFFFCLLSWFSTSIQKAKAFSGLTSQLGWSLVMLWLLTLVFHESKCQPADCRQQRPSKETANLTITLYTSRVVFKCWSCVTQSTVMFTTVLSILCANESLGNM